MPRTARQLSNSGYLHLIIRGIGKQILFEEREDYLFFLSIFRKYAGETGVSVLAYCLMDNHVHMLVYDPEGGSSRMMSKIGVSYSGYFNRKYERTGHLFQDRFKSEAVEDEAYLLTVFRYILNKPVKAGIPAASYPWSSFSLYEAGDSFVDTTVLREKIGDTRQYIEFLNAEDDTDVMEYETAKHDDAWAAEVVRAGLGVKSGTELQGFDRGSRDAALRALKQKGLTIRQIERITGINRGVIQKA